MAVICLRNNRAGGHTLLREEQLQAWLREAYPAKTLTSTPNPNRWLKLVDLIQFIWYNGSIPMELGCNGLVKIPRVNADTGGGIYVGGFVEDGGGGDTPNPNRCLKLVDLIQFIWDNGSIPMALGCNGLLKIPRINVDTGGLCMLEVLWKMVEAVIPPTQIAV